MTSAAIKTDIPELLSGSHAGALLQRQPPDLDLEAGAAEFSAQFEERLLSAGSPRQFADTLHDIKLDVASLYIRHLAGPAENDTKTMERLGRFWTGFADWSIDQALRFVWQQPEISRFLIEKPDTGETKPGLFVLGLGKLGGQDLNYSSDVDLVAFFDIEAFTVKATAGKTDVAIRALKTLTQLLGGTKGPRIWRVDWRLRPDPSVTGLAMSAEAGLDFFFFKAAPWRRLAMMKARAVAGDIAAGEHFLKELTPFLWRRNLDFRAIEEIGGIKSRIRNEHPDLEEQREADVPIAQTDGFHVKLGHGGIREIEFVVNALQLVWGGKQPGLRSVNTLQSLGTLPDFGHLDKEESEKLAVAYKQLRGLENRIQILNDGHTHRVPEAGSAEFEQLLALYESKGLNLPFELTTIRQFVNAIFEKTFALEDSTSAAQENAGASSDWQLDERGQSVLSDWQSGFLSYGVPPDLKQKMEPLFNALTSYLDQATNQQETLVAIHEHFLSLPPGGQYLRLLAECPELVKDILAPLSSGGALARLLKHSPHVADTLIQWQGRTISTAEERMRQAQFVRSQRDYESKLEAIRLHVNEMLYLAYLRAWRGECSAFEATGLLTQLAEEALDLTTMLVAEEYEFDRNQISIAAYGKLGMGSMMPESDLDIIFFAHGSDGLEPEDVQQIHRFSNRLKTALTTEMRGGKVYEIDTRLRPSGASGAPTIRLSTFGSHQMEHAKTWEHLALVPCRFVMGPTFARDAFNDERQRVLLRPRDQEQLVKDAHSMLDQLRTHRIREPDADTFGLKLAPGGLMEAEYLIAFLCVKHAAATAELATIDKNPLGHRWNSSKARCRSAKCSKETSIRQTAAAIDTALLERHTVLGCVGCTVQRRAQGLQPCNRRGRG